MRKTKKELEAELAAAKQEIEKWQEKYMEASAALVALAQAQARPVYTPYVQYKESQTVPLAPIPPQYRITCGGGIAGTAVIGRTVGYDGATGKVSQ
jgi:hypothetical protein